MSVPLNYQVHMLPDATVTKSNQNNLEIITLEHGALPAYTEELGNVPPDLVLYPQIEFSTGTSWQRVGV